MTSEHVPPCSDKAYIVDVAACFDAAFQSADRQLNSLYKKSITILPPDARGLYESRSGIGFSSETPSVLPSAMYIGGTAIGPAYLACMEEQTRLRINDLQVAYGPWPMLGTTN